MKQACTHLAFLLAIIFAFCSRASALDPWLDINQYAHTAWKVRDGFTRGAIYSIAQTPDGYLWLGTEFGLVRFDGIQTIPWEPPENQYLPHGPIYSLLAARDGTLWIGTRGLATWKDGKLTQYPELADQFVLKLLEDHEGTLWAGGVGVPTGRLCAIHKLGVDCRGEDGGLGRGLFGLYEDTKGNLWAGGQDGLWRWKPGPPEFYSLPGEPNGIQAFAEDTDGTLLVGWKHGIYRFSSGKTERYSFRGIPHQFEAKKILRDRDAGFWIATWNHGLIHVHEGRTDVFSALEGLSADDVHALFEDREGNIWISTAGGLDRFRDFAVATVTVKQGLSGNVVGSVLADKNGDVWLSTFAGLNQWVRGKIKIPEAGTTMHHGMLNGLSPESFFQDERGRIWVSTSREVGYLENGRFISTKGIPAGSVLSIVEDAARNLWVINENVGLFRISPENDLQRIAWTDLGHKDHASVLSVDRKRGALWIGFFLGGIVYFSGGQVRESYTVANGLGSGRVSDFLFDADGTLWISTAGGLTRLKDNRLVTLTSKNGLPCDAVHWAIFDNDHSMWLYTACGLVRIKQSDLDFWAAAVDKKQDSNLPVRATVFDSSDGVRSLPYPSHWHPQVAKTEDGKLWFLPWDGVSVIDPHKIPFNKIPPPVHVEQIIADRKTYDSASHPTGTLNLPPNVHDLEIDFSALSLVASERNRFRYKLEGFDRDWQDVGNRRQAFYTNVPPRRYRFRVVASNSSGVWNEAGTVLDFSIDPAWYQTAWFRALCVVAFLALLWGTYQLRVRQLRYQEKKLRDVIETMPTFAWTARPDGFVDFVNRHWQEYTGLSTERTVGSGWQEAVHPEDLQRHVHKWRLSLASGESFESEVRYRRAPDGQYRWYLARAVPQRDGQGKILKWYGISTDIEDRKRAEQERETLRSDLAHVNRVSMLGELAASISHELKQPITAAMLNASTCISWLKREKPDLEEACGTANNILRAGKRATEIIDRLRSLYKKAPSQRESVDVNEIISEMAVMLRGEANRYSISMRTEAATNLPKIVGDRVQLQQVLMNLMLNGIEAMKDAGGELTIRTELEQGGQALISVSDTGVGLPAEKTQQIFDAFYTTKPQGSGMGLSISRSIVESHGGHLWATPNSGLGAVFYFTLPTAAGVVKVPVAGNHSEEV